MNKKQLRAMHREMVEILNDFTNNTDNGGEVIDWETLEINLTALVTEWCARKGYLEVVGEDHPAHQSAFDAALDWEMEHLGVIE